MLAGLLSVVAITGGGAAAIVADLPRPLALAAAATLLALGVGWWTHRRPGRAARTRIDEVAQYVSLGLLSLPASLLVWPSTDHVTTGALVSSIAAGVGLSGYLTLQWRR